MKLDDNGCFFVDPVKKVTLASSNLQKSVGMYSILQLCANKDYNSQINQVLNEFIKDTSAQARNIVVNKKQTCNKDIC